jgi:hypothetical protein
MQNLTFIETSQKNAKIIPRNRSQHLRGSKRLHFRLQILYELAGLFFVQIFFSDNRTSDPTERTIRSRF